MLVLVSFGLVLLATILLVVGLLNDDGLTLIYLSIGASATAAIVLYLAFRMARPKDEASAEAPEPLEGEDLSAVVADTTTASPDVMAETPAAPTAPPPPPPTAPVPAASVPDAEPATPAGEDQWADDADWEVDDDLDFPIADYDDLSVAEIMPLLPQLYSDELDVVYEREQSGKNRSTILARLEKLKETGTEADAAEAGVEAPVTDIEVADDPTQTVVAPAPAPAPSSISLLDDDDDAAFFPIADYDDLSVSQIVPLLPQLEADELEDVRAREQAGANRKTLLTEIDRHLSGDTDGAAWSGDDEPSDRDTLPIAGYDELNVADIRPQLGGLSPSELAQVLEYEQARDNRKTIVSDITSRLESTPEATPAPAKRSASKKSAPRKAAAKKTAAKKAAKSARKATKKAAAARFPIANYDELNVSDIRPRLTKLSDAQLRQVREREASGAGRKTILNDIDSRLS